MNEIHEREADAKLLECLYQAVGKPPEGELVSETLLGERREEASKEEAND